MNARSQEREDELKYLDLTEGDPDRTRIYIVPARNPTAWNWRDRFGMALIVTAAWALVVALGLGVRDEVLFLGRIFH